MTQQTITRNKISNVLAQEIDVPKQRAYKILDAILDEMTTGLIKDEYLKLSFFGRFVVQKKTERIGLNPKTGVESMIIPRKVVSFKASHSLKKKIIDSEIKR